MAVSHRPNLRQAEIQTRPSSVAGVNLPPAQVAPGAPVQWLSGVGGNWNTAEDWTGGAVPDASTDVTIAAAGACTVTINTAATANSLVLNGAAATLADTAGGALVIGATFSLKAGTFSLSGGGALRSYSELPPSIFARSELPKTIIALEMPPIYVRQTHRAHFFD